MNSMKRNQTLDFVDDKFVLSAFDIESEEEEEVELVPVQIRFSTT
jgi:hypothetical protein